MAPTATTTIGRLIQRSIAAEARAVEEGHHAVWDDDARCFTVKSDTTDATYKVGVEAVQAKLRVPRYTLRLRCTCPAGVRSRDDLACKHGAVVARRLERMGLAEWDGRDGSWRPTGGLLEYAQAANQPRPTAPTNVRALVD